MTKDELTREKIFANIPLKIKDIDEKIEQDLPAGWFMNYCNVYK